MSDSWRIPADVFELCFGRADFLKPALGLGALGLDNAARLALLLSPAPSAALTDLLCRYRFLGFVCCGSPLQLHQPVLVLAFCSRCVGRSRGWIGRCSVAETLCCSWMSASCFTFSRPDGTAVSAAWPQHMSATMSPRLNAAVRFGMADVRPLRCTLA